MEWFGIPGAASRWHHWPSPKVADMYQQHLLQAMMGAEELLAALFLLPHNLMSPSTLGEHYPTKGFNNLIFLQCFHFKKKKKFL